MDWRVAIVRSLFHQSLSPPPPTPQERFDNIVAYMRENLEERGMGEFAGRFTFRDASGVGSTAWTYEIEASPKIASPKDGSELFRAAIKVIYETTYTSSRSAAAIEETDKKKRAKEKKRGKSFSSDDDSDEGEKGEEDSSGIEILDPNPMLGSPEILRPELPTRTPKSVTEYVYHLEYHDGQWEIIQPKPKGSLSAIDNTLKAAIERQG